jgi:hypothetical protein
VLSGETTNTNLIAFDLIRSGLEATIYPTQGELSNHYPTDTAINVQRKQDKMTNNDLQNITQKTKIEHQDPAKNMIGREVPAPHVTTWACPFLLVLVGFFVVQCCKISVL